MASFSIPGPAPLSLGRVERGAVLGEPSGTSGLSAELTVLQPMVRAVVARVMHLPLKHPDVEDCVAETFRRIVENLGRVRAGEPVGPWATGVARHVALDSLRSKKRERARSADLEPTSSPGPELADAAPSPEDRALDAESLGLVRRALAELDEGPREAILAFHVEGRSYQEIAERLKVPMGTVATWIARSRRTLSESIERARRTGK